MVKGWNRRTEDDLSVVSTINTSDQRSTTMLIDYPSLLQASQAIALETSNNGVVEQLLSLALTNAGAERASLFMPHHGEWALACSGNYSSGEVIFQADH